MIWVDGEIIPDDALRISAQDRTFEHGLGLFETFRTWNGHATLLARHLDRMARSAAALGMNGDPLQLPDDHAVKSLRLAEGIEGDARLRLTMSGGMGPDGTSTIWLRAASIAPELTTMAPATLMRSGLAVSDSEELARHKTLNYWDRRRASEKAARDGADEALVESASAAALGRFGAIEGARSNLFVIDRGVLVTVGDDAPILSGIMRGMVLEFADRLSIPHRLASLAELQNGDCPLCRLGRGEVDEAFLTNSVWGIRPVGNTCGNAIQAPGPITRALWAAVLPWLQSGGR